MDKLLKQQEDLRRSLSTKATLLEEALVSKKKKKIQENLEDFESEFRKLDQVDKKILLKMYEEENWRWKIPDMRRSIAVYQNTFQYWKHKAQEILEKLKTGIIEDVLGIAVKAGIMTGVVLGGTALVVPALGFGASGVVAGSMAAAYQSSVLGGTIAAGSGFATLQSIGAAGLAASTQASVFLGSTVMATLHKIFK